MDKDYLSKMTCLQWISPDRFGVPNTEIVFKPAVWALAVKKCRVIGRLRTPSEKLEALVWVMSLLQLNFKMAYGHRKEAFASTDDLFPSLVYVLCQAKLETPFCTERFLEVFMPCDSQIGEEAMRRVIFFTANQHLLNLNGRNLDLTEKEFLYALQHDEAPPIVLE